MFQDQSLQELITLLRRRNVKLYHACQFSDFKSYLRLGGVPSRQLLENGDLPFTTFISDTNDRNNGDWDKVFGNFSDFGSTFARGYGAVPNVYGPILFRLWPEAFQEAEDVAICLRSAGTRDFNRESESLTSIDEVNKLFVHDENHEHASYLKRKIQLREDFGNSNASAPEFSCTVTSGKLSLEHVHYITVDQYVFNDQFLLALAEREISGSDWNFRAYAREDKISFRIELGEAIYNNASVSLANLVNDNNGSPEIKKWAQEILDRGLEYQFERFREYLSNGTMTL